MPDTDQSGTRGIKELIRMSPHFLPFIMKTSLSYFKLRRDAKKAGRIFEKTLIEEGISRDMAHVMAEEYRNSTSFIKTILSNMESW